MKKLITSVLLVCLLFGAAGCGSKGADGGDSQGTADADKAVDRTVNHEKEGTPCELTEEQEQLTGMWESPEGCIMAIRARSEAAVNNDWGSGFPLDVIYFYPYNFEGFEETDSKGWTKFTTDDDGCGVSAENGNIVLVNSTLCPAMENPDEYVNCEYKIVLDTNTDEMFFSYTKEEWIEGDQVAYSFTLLPSETSIEEANWDWYYSLEPDRDPRN